ncbi:MAG: hypothetical protein JO332_02845 [Planctomycetaceae bacterium]|nr:hypothetical protein [Planctomycetaceae bacterium]
MTLTQAMLVALVTVGLGATAAAAPGKDLSPFFDAVRALVEKHYPKAAVTAKAARLTFEFNTRKYMVHEPLKTGEWQDAHEELGPQKGGVVGEIDVVPGRYEGAAVVPQGVDKRYFVLWFAAPSSEKLGVHLLVHLKYPPNAPKEFLKDFTELVEKFESLAR